MIDFSSAQITQLTIHYAGSKAKDEVLKLSDKNALEMLGDDEETLLLKYFLKPFTNEEFFGFTHSSDVSMNEVYNFAKRIFENEKFFIPLSMDICKHLFECSDHPKIKAGEVYIALLRDCNINNETVDALGIFKSENKDKYLNVEFNRSGLSKINVQEGIDPSRLDKGCLIFNSNEGEGFDVLVVDNTNRGGEAQYWVDDFLQLLAKQDNYFNTANYLKLCKEFVVNELPKQFEVGKTDQIGLLNRSVDYFKNQENFDTEEFTSTVFEQPEIINSFNGFKEQFETDHGFSFTEDFEISTSAVKKQARVFKSVLKLDKNFHVYIHGDRNLIERGVDEATGKKYYKIYFDEES